MIVRPSRKWLMLALAFALAATGCASDQPKQFASPQAAADALVSTLRVSNTAQLKKVFGPDGDQIISSGDPVADQAEIARFLTAYDAQHRLQTQPDTGATTLLVGANDWPFPVPIVQADN